MSFYAKYGISNRNIDVLFLHPVVFPQLKIIIFKVIFSGMFVVLQAADMVLALQSVVCM